MNLFLKVNSVTNLPENDSHESMNPYVIVNLISHNIVRQTRVINNTFNPVFNQVLTFPINFIDGDINGYVIVKNRDIFGADKKVGYCDFRQKFTSMEVFNKTIKIKTSNESTDSFINIELQIARMNQNMFGVQEVSEEIHEIKEVSVENEEERVFNTLNDFFSPFSILRPSRKQNRVYIEEEDDDDIVIIDSIHH